MKSLMVIPILLCCIMAIVHSRFYYPFCTKDFVERYCAIEDRNAFLECLVEVGNSRAIEIFEGCFASMYTEEVSLLGKTKKACEHHTVENEMLRRCSAIGALLQDKKDGKVINLIEECLAKMEKIENKHCYRPEVMFRNPFGYLRRYP